MRYKNLLLIASLTFVFWIPARKKITIYAIGDSTMADYNWRQLIDESGSLDYPLRGWMMPMDQFFNKEATIRNMAVGGRSSKNFRTQLYWDAIMKMLNPGDYVFIQFGHNDEKISDTSRGTDPKTTFRQNLLNYIHDAKQKGANPVLFTSIVRRTFDSAGRLVDTHGDYVTEVRTLAAETKTPLVDLNQKTAKLVEDLGPEASKKLFLFLAPQIYPKFPYGLKDETHLSVEGATKVAKLAAEGIRELHLPLAGYLKK